MELTLAKVVTRALATTKSDIIYIYIYVCFILTVLNFGPKRGGFNQLGFWEVPQQTLP